MDQKSHSYQPSHDIQLTSQPHLLICMQCQQSVYTGATCTSQIIAQSINTFAQQNPQKLQIHTSQCITCVYMCMYKHTGTIYMYIHCTYYYTCTLYVCLHVHVHVRIVQVCVLTCRNLEMVCLSWALMDTTFSQSQNRGCSSLPASRTQLRIRKNSKNNLPVPSAWGTMSMYIHIYTLIKDDGFLR